MQTDESMVDLVAGKFVGRKNILIMGVTFKENVHDTRNSKAIALTKKLADGNFEVFIYDPFLIKNELASSSELKECFEKGIVHNLPLISFSDMHANDVKKFDGVIVFSPHDIFKGEEFSLGELKKICELNSLIFDVKGFYDKAEAEKAGFKYLTL